ncbi:hypothetical protein [Niabella beijingensis]|uniref:hypothetical protein n=1 Tax=Niabella beijingensis TaxID=2872700 RepID=UPI001CBC6F70|nr:hypothetical protein [Niabella beijingensis]MBZ4187744.1 hypothetical protein [Niabella beijingensis]
MSLEYRTDKEDYIYYTLFSAAVVSNIRENIRRKRLLYGVVFIALGFLFKESGSGNGSLYYFATAGVVFMVFGGWYLKIRYRNFYASYAEKTFSANFNKYVTLDISDEELQINTELHSLRFSTRETEAIFETGTYYFIKRSAGFMIFIPKLRIQDPGAVKQLLQAIAEQQQKPYQELLNWKW